MAKLYMAQFRLSTELAAERGAYVLSVLEHTYQARQTHNPILAMLSMHCVAPTVLSRQCVQVTLSFQMR